MGLSLMIACLVAPPAALGQQSLDPFDSYTLNPEQVNGDDEPYAPASPIVRETPEVDTSEYVTQAAESGNTNNRSGCPIENGAYSWMGRTAWVRFLPGVAGTLTIRADADYDAIIAAWEGPPSGGFTDYDELRSLGCTDAVRTAGDEELVGVRVTPNLPVHIQIGAICARKPPPARSGCPDPDVAQGGRLLVRVVFSPDNRDRDEVPDTLDSCPDAPGPSTDSGCPPPAAQPTASGNPPAASPDADADADADGVPDDRDACPAVVGSAAPPENGCPLTRLAPTARASQCNGVPVSPTPYPSLTINNGALATRSRFVTLLFPHWPAGTKHIYVANDGGTPPARFDATRCIEGWELPSTGPERSPRLVYVTYAGDYGTVSVIDDIILDERPPDVIAGRAVRDPANPSSYRIPVTVADDRSGVGSITVRDRRGRPIRTIRICRQTDRECELTQKRTIVVPVRSRPSSITAIDRAQNESQPVPLLGVTACAESDEIRVDLGKKVVCVGPGDRCRQIDKPKFKNTPLKCINGRLRRR
jgi:hypothetical protein